MQTIYKRGFTLIELLVVIAIIGILAGIVLASLGSARNGANDAKTKEQLSNVRTAMESYYLSNNNSYGTAGSNCTGGSFLAGAGALTNGSNYASSVTLVCNNSTSAWAVQANLVSESGFFWCVDSTGAARRTSTALSTNVVCPAGA